MTIRQFQHIVSCHFDPFWRKLRCGRSLLRSGPGQVAHCRSKRRHRRAWDRIAAMARWPVGHAVLYKSLPPHPSLCETWWPSCNYSSASLWVITVTIGKICKCKLIFSSPMFTNVHQCSPSLILRYSKISQASHVLCGLDDLMTMTQICPDLSRSQICRLSVTARVSAVSTQLCRKPSA